MSHLPWFDHWICWSLLGGSIMGQWGESRKVQSWPIRSKEFVKQQLSFDGFCSPWLMMVHGERSNGGWKVQTRWELEGSHCHEKLDSRMSFSGSRVCCLFEWVYSGWLCMMMTGDAAIAEWVNNPVQLPAGSKPGPGTLDCEPGPVPWSGHSQPRVFIEAAPDYRWSKASDDSWSKISLHRLYWNPELTWTLNQ